MAGDSYEYKTITYVPGHGDKRASAEKAKNVHCPLAVAIGATIISGMITVYKEVPEQMGREFRAYGAKSPTASRQRKATMEEAAVAPVYDMLKDKEIIGAAPFLYERLKINESPVLTGGTDFNEVKR